MRFRNWLRNLNSGVGKTTRRAQQVRMQAAESLEQRTLPAVSILLTGTELCVESDDGDNISISAFNGNVVVQTAAPGGQLFPSSAVGSLPASSVTSLIIKGGDQENTIDLSGVRAADFTGLTQIRVEGDNGDDLITGSPDIANALIGQDGNDTLTGGTSNDTLDGGDGRDSITADAGNDSVLGGDGSDSITTGDGNDTVDAGNGQDSVSLGNGDDSIFAGNGEDSILGEAGNDTLNGDGGTDTVLGGDGDDSILGGEFADSLFGDAGNDTINGQGGNDSIDGGLGNDSIRGAAGNDSIDGNFGDDNINGELGLDTINGGDGNDTIQGGGGNDVVSGDAGNDIIRGQAGNDTVTGGGGADQIDGGDGEDLVRTFAPNAVPLPSVSIDDASRVEGNPISPFGLTQTYTTSVDFQQAITSNDFDGDGDVDILVAGQSFGNNQSFAQVMLNNGTGAFSQGTILPPPVTNFRNGTDAVSADYDGDGDNDIVISDNFNDEVLLYLNNGDSTFAAATPLPLPLFAFTEGLATGDLDGDGDQDFATANGFDGSVSIFSNDGTATFTRSDLSITGFLNSQVMDIIADDLDNDGDLDLAVSINSFFFGTTVDVAIILNFGSGAFAVSSQIDFIANNNTFQLDELVTLDIDNDGDRDLALGDGFTDQVHILRNDGGGGFTFLTSLSANTNAFNLYLASGDFNLDGNEDLVSVTNFGNFNQSLSVFFSNGDGTFDVPVLVSLPGTFNSGGPVLARDLNGDGALDLAIASEFFTNELFILLNTTPTNIPQVTLAITLSQPSTVPVTVSYSTGGGTASANSDYVATTGVVTFLPGETVKNVTVRVRVDRTPEPTENFFVTLTSATNAIIADGQGQVRLIDDDGGPAVTFLTINNLTLDPEGNNGVTNATLTVTLSGAANTTPVTVDFATADGSAVANSDYTPVTGQLVFAPGVLTQTITIPVFADGRFEPNENFVINLSNPVGAILVSTRSTVTIVDDDATPGNPTLLGGNGNDTLVGAEGNELLNGGAGNDLINAGDGADTLLGGLGDDTLNGEAGDDSLNGQGGHDILNGGEGNDLLGFNGNGQGNDTAIGGNGFDQMVVNGNGATNNFVISANTGLLQVVDGSGSITADKDIRGVIVNGGNGDDSFTITGSLAGVTATQLELHGDGGNDTIIGTGATLGTVRLLIDGGAGDDTVAGTNSDDTIQGGLGNDFLVGGLGHDTMDGGDGADTLKGQDGNDSVSGGNGTDLVQGDAGNDFAAGNAGEDLVLGGDGNDTLQGNDGNDTLNGQAGDDSLSGSVGQDILAGGLGNDTLDGGRNDDTINGQAGNDVIRGDHGDDRIDGGEGNDSINGGDGNDSILGQAGNDLINGGDGDDTINSDGGDDTVVGGDGRDNIAAGAGNDVVLGEDGDDTINGQGGLDTVAGNQGADTIADPASEIIEPFILSQAVLDALNAL